jgi:hypothetical protein
MPAKKKLNIVLNKPVPVRAPRKKARKDLQPVVDSEPEYSSPAPSPQSPSSTPSISDSDTDDYRQASATIRHTKAVAATTTTTAQAASTAQATATATAPATSMEGDVPALDIAGPSKRKKSKALLLTEEQEVDIGEWLRNHPELYSKALKSYKDVGKKTKLWDDKARDIGLESGVLLKTWYESIRTKVGKMTKEKSGSATKDVTDREVFIRTNFGFLGDHISRIRGRSACSVSIVEI